MAWMSGVMVAGGMVDWMRWQAERQLSSLARAWAAGQGEEGSVKEGAGLGAEQGGRVVDRVQRARMRPLRKLARRWRTAVSALGSVGSVGRGMREAKSRTSCQRGVLEVS